MTSSGNSPTSAAASATSPASTEAKSSTSSTNKSSSRPKKAGDTFEPTKDESNCISKFRKSNEELFDDSVDLTLAQGKRLFEGYRSCLDRDRFVEYVVIIVNQRDKFEGDQLACLTDEISAMSDDEIIDEISSQDAIFSSIRESCGR